jgi:glyoxylate/hydroxypyruvate reductase A
MRLSPRSRSPLRRLATAARSRMVPELRASGAPKSAGLQLLISHPDAARCAEWVAALGANLPAAQVHDWQADSPPADYAVGWAVPQALFANQQRLRAFFCAGSGVDDLLESGAVPAGLAIIRVEDAGMGVQMADYCTAAVMDWFTQAQLYALQQARMLWRELPQQRRGDWPIGVLGQGVLGRAVTERLAGLGFTVRGCTRGALQSGQVVLEEFLAASRVLILMAPLTPLTRGLMDAHRIAQLPRGACLINVARGALVVESALLGALESGQLAAAALDVFDREPLPLNHPYWHHPQIRITPHIAAFTDIEPAARQIAERIRQLERGVAVQRLAGLVGRERGY